MIAGAPTPTELSAILGKHRAKLGIVLGSGLNHVADLLDIHTTLPYADLPNFGACSVKGHQGRLAFGRFDTLEVACFQGRLHSYEGTDGQSFIAMMAILKHIGCTHVLLTNAAGSLNEHIQVGQIAIIEDHINFQGCTPLLGIRPTPFIGMTNAYNDVWREAIITAAKAEDIHLVTGVYAGVLGPQFETPAEIQMLRGLGADLVGMSTVQEAIAARYVGLTVAAVSMITNMAAGMRSETLSHDLTLAGAKIGEKQMTKLITLLCQQMADSAC